MPTLAILGSGGWGTALAVVLAQRPEHEIRLWSYRGDVAERLRDLRENTQQLPGVRIPDSISITSSVEDATRGADAWVTAIPTAYLRSTLKLFHAVADPGVPVVSLTKGIEIETFRRPSEIIRRELGMAKVVVLSGPSHAEEVARGGPTSLVAACEDAALAAWVQHHFGSDRLRVYTNSDLVGVELAGADSISQRRRAGRWLSGTARDAHCAQGTHSHLGARDCDQPRRLRQGQDQGPGNRPL